MNAPAARRAASVVLGAAAALVIVAVAILPFLTPAWLSFEQDRADAAAWTGFAPTDVRAATDSLVHDLVLGPPAFDVQVGGVPVLTEPERAHLRDVRGVFAGLAIAALLSAVLVLVALALGGRRAWPWRAIRGGALALVAATAVLAVVAGVAFDAAFELFHRLFFAGGTYSFDPATDRLVQLFPDRLWFETTLAVGIVMVLLALLVAWQAGRRSAALGPADAPAPAPMAIPGTAR